MVVNGMMVQKLGRYHPMRDLAVGVFLDLSQLAVEMFISRAGGLVHITLVVVNC